MVSIRLQRIGRRHHARFRVVVQDSRQAPTSGRVIAILGVYDPHTKESRIDTDKAAVYLKNGAQPSARVAKLLAGQKVRLPDWVKTPPKRSDKTRQPDKLRRNRPAEAKAPAEAASNAVGAETAETAPQAEAADEAAGTEEKAEDADQAAPPPAEEAAAEKAEKAEKNKDT